MMLVVIDSDYDDFIQDMRGELFFSIPASGPEMALDGMVFEGTMCLSPLLWNRRLSRFRRKGEQRSKEYAR